MVSILFNVGAVANNIIIIVFKRILLLQREIIWFIINKNLSYQYLMFVLLDFKFIASTILVRLPVFSKLIKQNYQIKQNKKQIFSLCLVMSFYESLIEEMALSHR